MRKQAGDERHPHLPARKIIDRVVLGGTDGIIESLAATSGLNGARQSFVIILLAGFAFATAGAVSMFFSNFLSRRTEQESLRLDIEREKMEIETEPEEEKRELETLLKNEGYNQKEVDVILKRVMRDKDMWLRVQLRHELHLDANELESSSLKKSFPPGIAFFVGALIPLAPYLAPLQPTIVLLVSVGLSLVALFLTGSSKFLAIRKLSLSSGLEMALVGAIASALLFVVGRLIATL
jgi:VIT1/CCC1 family predicted Fe2+/Mn2+ transporter